LGIGFGIMKKNNIFLPFCITIVSFYLQADVSFRPIPWVTHEAFLFLEKFMAVHPEAKVLEFGAGSSTIWFAQRTKHLVSIEHSEHWFNCVKNALANNGTPATLVLHNLPYYDVCNQFEDNFFDLILVDGRNRSGCIKNAIRILKTKGVLMVDNAERPYYQKALNLLGSWKSFSHEQKSPDTCGFMYPGWKTNWYIKP
jgi:predicted O-methyltransferase YrrM